MMTWYVLFNTLINDTRFWTWQFFLEKCDLHVLFPVLEVLSAISRTFICCLFLVKQDTNQLSYFFQEVTLAN